MAKSEATKEGLIFASHFGDTVHGRGEGMRAGSWGVWLYYTCNQEIPLVFLIQ